MLLTLIHQNAPVNREEHHLLPRTSKFACGLPCKNSRFCYCISAHSTTITEILGFLLRSTRRFHALFEAGSSTTVISEARCGLNM